MKLKSPYPYPGGKSKIAKDVWLRFGVVKNYVEPFFGSGAVLLGRPGVDLAKLPKETVNDLDGFISNFWRAVQADPDEVAKWADWPANENDLHARHYWLVSRAENLTRRLEGDPEYYDAKTAGWWVWGIALWISGGWCKGNGPWEAVDMEDGTRQLLRLGDDEHGVKRQLLHLGGMGNGQGVNRKRLQLGNSGNGTTVVSDLHAYMQALQARLRRVRVSSGDWSRVVTPSVTTKHGRTAVFLDPPYNDEAGRDGTIYREESLSISRDVRTWAIENGDNPLFRIALCGYEKEHGPYMPDDWECFIWDAGKGYAAQNKSRDNKNGKQERVWFSPHCLHPGKDVLSGVVDNADYSDLFTQID